MGQYHLWVYLFVTQSFRYTLIAMNPRIAECHKFAVAGGCPVKVNCQAWSMSLPTSLDSRRMEGWRGSSIGSTHWAHVEYASIWWTCSKTLLFQFTLGEWTEPPLHSLDTMVWKCCGVGDSFIRGPRLFVEHSPSRKNYSCCCLLHLCCLGCLMLPTLSTWLIGQRWTKMDKVLVRTCTDSTYALHHSTCTWAVALLVSLSFRLVPLVSEIENEISQAKTNQQQLLSRKIANRCKQCAEASNPVTENANERNKLEVVPCHPLPCHLRPTCLQPCQVTQRQGSV